MTREPGPTSQQLRVMEAYVRLGSQKAVSHELGISTQTVKNHMGGLYGRLGVGGVMEALTRLGWVALPGDGPATCGWIGSCSLLRGHLEDHDHFRALGTSPTI